MRSPPPELLRSFLMKVFEKKSSDKSSLFIFTSKWDFVTQSISYSSAKFWRKYNLFLILLMFILHMEIYLSTLLMVMFTGGFELYLPGPGCVSTSPIIGINCNTYNRKTILISGIKLCRRNRDKTRAEH